MKILILGGTVFLGRALVAAAQSRGHELTLFTRGHTNAHLYPEIARLTGDRRGDQSALATGEWDAVIDTSAYVPRSVDLSARILSDRVERYIFVSTVSVYAETDREGITEQFPVSTLEDPTAEEITGETYGALKALCEQSAERAMPGRVCVVRPGLIVGPHDPSDRFTYWPARIAKGGTVLAPGRPGRNVQFIDVRDLAEFLIRAAETGIVGTYNADGVPPTPMGTVLDTCNAVAGNAATLQWIDDDTLTARGAGPWMEVPLWIPESEPSAKSAFSVDCSRAVAAGLAHRPLAETIRATLEWARNRPLDHVWRAGMSAERERELLGM